MFKQQAGVYAGSKISQTLKNSMRQAIMMGNYLNTSDFVRDAIKEKLQREGYVVLNSWSDQYSPVESSRSSESVNKDGKP